MWSTSVPDLINVANFWMSQQITLSWKYKLADSCEFGEMKDQLIRDCLVVGIHDGALSECLQL